MEAFWQFTTIFFTKFSLSDWWLIVSYMLNETHPHSHSPVSSLLFSNFWGAGSICFLAKQREALMVPFSQSFYVDHWIFLHSQSMVGDLPQTYRHTTLLSLIGRFCPHSVIIIFCFIMLFIIRLLMIEMIDDGCLMLRGEDLRISPPPQVSQFTYRSLAVSSRCSLIWQLVPS